MRRLEKIKNTLHTYKNALKQNNLNSLEKKHCMQKIAYFEKLQTQEEKNLWRGGLFNKLKLIFGRK